MEVVYEMGSELGRGADGVVKKCTHRLTGVEYACKVSSKTDEISLVHARSEIAMLSRLQQHPNIVHLEAHWEDEAAVHAVMELCAGGDLFQRIDYLRSERSVGEGEPVLDESEAVEAFVAVVNAVRFCHSRGIMHRDIKLENLLLPHANCGYSDLKLADFGVAADFVAQKVFIEMEGTHVYQAPEVLCGGLYNEKADMWSLGVLLYIMLCDAFPFTGSTPAHIYRSVHSRKLLLQLHNPWPPLSHHARDLVLGLLQTNPSKRMSFIEIMTHPLVCSLSCAIKIGESTINDNTFDEDVHVGSTSKPLGLPIPPTILPKLVPNKQHSPMIETMQEAHHMPTPNFI